jgi:single-strand DNA-binding protein
MNDINRVVIIGRLTKEPELKYTQGGTAIAHLSIANNKSYTVNGEKKDLVSYFDLVAWGKLGEIMAEHCKKGRRIGIEGRLSQSRWQDKDGGNRSKVEIVIDNFQFLDGKASDTDVRTYVPEQTGAMDNPFAGDDNQIPF